jgi:hypoxanthine phosphoribosyltransferase
LVNEIKKLRRSNGTSVQLSLEFIRVKSYTNESSGGVKISLTDAELEEFKGKVSIDLGKQIIFSFFDSFYV